MALAAIGNRDFLTLEGIIKPVRETLATVEDLNLDTVLHIPLTMQTLSFVYGVLQDMPENQYSKVNSNLADALIELATGDAEIAAWLTEKVVDREKRMNLARKAGSQFLTLPIRIE